MGIQGRGGARSAGSGRAIGSTVLASTLVLALFVSAAPRDAAAESAEPVDPVVAAAKRGEVVPPAIDDVEHMCALLTACDRIPLPPSMIPADFPACVRRYTAELASPDAVRASLSLRECGVAAMSCTTLRSCLLRGVREDVCAGRGGVRPVGLCDPEGRAVTCWKDRVLAVRDCPRGGEQCAVAGGDALCALGACPAGMSASRPVCSPSGTRRMMCESGRLVSLDCAALGLRCVSGPSGASCATDTPSCADRATRCDGTTAVGCFHGHEVRVDCAAAGLVCRQNAGGRELGACATPDGGAACNAAAQGQCEGATIRYCLAGKPRSYACKGVGFARCAKRKEGVRCEA